MSLWLDKLFDEQRRGEEGEGEEEERKGKGKGKKGNGKGEEGRGDVLLRACILAHGTYLSLSPLSLHRRITSSLRLLSLLTTYGGVFLSSSPASSLTFSHLSLPPSTFVPIVQQVFARLSHPHPLVREYLQVFLLSFSFSLSLSFSFLFLSF